MNKSDLKNLIKPMVKECIHEVLLEEGLLSNIVSEVAKGMQGNVMVESAPKQSKKMFDENLRVNKSIDKSKKLKEHRTALMKSIGRDAYNGVNLFEGTEAMTAEESSAPKAGTVDLGSSKDPGVDISSLVGNASKIWKAIK